MNAISGALIGQRRAATLVEHDGELRLFALASTMFARAIMKLWRRKFPQGFCVHASTYIFQT